MADLVVTVPKHFWFEWIAEGDAAGDPPTGTEWAFWLAKARPSIEPGERLYVVSWGRLRGYAPVTRIGQDPASLRWAICREGRAVDCTLQGRRIDGFRGARKRWWDRSEEIPFLSWKTAGIPPAAVDKAIRAGHLGRGHARA